MFDVIFRGGKLIDGTGNPAFSADIAFQGEKIAFIGWLPPETEAAKIIDCRGKIIAPGFIDAHSHSDVTVFSHPESYNKAAQGITTDISGMCGTSNAPRDPAMLKIEEKHHGQSMPYLADYAATMEHLKALPLGVNMGQYVGHGSLRSIVCRGDQNRPLTPKELDALCGLAGEAMDAGAVGVSFGLIYPPGSYADLEELSAVAACAAKRHKSFSVHMRSESFRLVESVEDMIEVARRSGAKALISHHKAKGRENWNKSRQTLALIERANEEGLEVGLDQYPFAASATYLGVYIPQKFQSGGRANTLKLLRDPAMRREIRAEMERVNPFEESNFRCAGFDGTMVSRSPAHPEWEGKTMAEIATLQGKDPFDAAFDLLLDDELDTDGIYFMMNEADIIRIMQYPRTMVGTDGGGIAPGQITHPRILGTFPQVLGRYVRELGVLRPEEAIRKMTSLPANFFGLKHKGLLKEGFDADVVVYDPQTIACLSDYHHNRPNAGLSAVYIGGKQVVSENLFVQSGAGKLLLL